MELEAVDLDTLRPVLVHAYNVPPWAAHRGPTRFLGRSASLQSPLVQVIGFDHLVLAVADVERSLAWYTRVLGLAGDRV
jgi:hypothetical protein